MISVANNGLLPTVGVQEISKLSDAIFSAKKRCVFDKIGCVFGTLRVCYEDNLISKAQRVKQKKVTNLGGQPFDITLLVTGDKNLVGKINL